MLNGEANKAENNFATRRAEDISCHQQNIFKQTYKILAAFIGLQWLTIIFAASWFLPALPIGYAIFLGIAISLFPILFLYASKDLYDYLYGDITQSKQTDKETLYTSEERFRSLVDSIKDGYFEVDLSGTYVFLNAAFCQMCGYSCDEMLGLSYKKFFDDNQIRLLCDTYQGVYKTNTSNTFEYELTKKDGTKRFVEESVSLKKDAKGNAVGLMGIRRDCTERKLNEQEITKAKEMAEATTKAKSEFLANMSHEIRNPMHGILGMTDLLLDTNLTDEQREFAKAVHVCGNALLRIVNDILDFSKIEAGKLNLDTIDFDLRNCVEDVIELFTKPAQAKGIELAWHICNNVPKTLCGDPGRLRQVLINLIGNAVKFTQRGEVFIKIKAAEQTAETVLVRFEITDTGIGISPDAQANLFQSFYQADSSITRKYGGTGLGLAISKQLVELMCGQIGVESQPNKGSTFWFTVRL